MTTNTSDKQTPGAQAPRQLAILQEGNPALKKVCEEVQEIDGRVLKIVNDTAYTMLKSQKAIALSANQIGYDKRIVAIRSRDNASVFVLINPTIVKKSKRIVNSPEACLSVDRTSRVFNVSRHKAVTVTYMDLKGRYKKKEFKRRNALVIQHEIDHLNGILVSDIGTEERR